MFRIHVSFIIEYDRLIITLYCKSKDRRIDSAAPPHRKERSAAPPNVPALVKTLSSRYSRRPKPPKIH